MLFCLVVLAEQVQWEAQCKDFLLENQTILIAFVCFILKSHFTYLTTEDRNQFRTQFALFL